MPWALRVQEGLLPAGSLGPGSTGRLYSRPLAVSLHWYLNGYGISFQLEVARMFFALPASRGFRPG